MGSYLTFDEDIRLTKSHDSLIIQEPLFDMERMKYAIDDYETKEQALQNGLTLPQGKNETQLLAWLDENIPTHLPNADKLAYF